jgi:hypothetical protein
MFLHAIPPSRAFTKVSKALIGDTRLDPAARLLLAHLSGLKLEEGEPLLPLSEYAVKLGIKYAAYKRIKKELVRCGYVHDYRTQGAGGRWITDQWVSNVPLTEDQFTALRTDGHTPTVGQPSVRPVGRSTGTSKTDSEKSPTHPPQEAVAPDANAPQESTPDDDRQFALAEQILRSLGRSRQDLALSFRNARYLATAVAAHLRRGVPGWEIHAALTHDLPDGTIHNAAGFVTHRLKAKVPEPMSAAHDERLARIAAGADGDGLWAVEDGVAPPPPLKERRECEGTARPYAHLHRPVGDETMCGDCRHAQPELEARLREERGGTWAPIGAVAASVPPPPF